MDRPLARDEPKPCSAAGCARPHHSHGFCRTHVRRVNTAGHADAQTPVRRQTGSGGLSHGYVKKPVAPEDRWLVNGATSAVEHRLVMARSLGRPLRGDESVHHRNGDRTDNRPDNLELWSRYQPSGARVEDKVAWAYEILRRHDPELGEVLGWDLDPRTGLPLDSKLPDHTK